MRIDGSYILVCKDVDRLKQHILQLYPIRNLRFFEPDDFLLDDAKSVIKEAYIAENEQKVLVMISKSYNIYAQNSLLKILEEPPRNIIFILCAPSKTIFLPTIRSRLPIKVLEMNRTITKTGVDFKNISINEIYSFLSGHKHVDKNETKSLIQSFLNEALTQGIRLKESELDGFRKLLHLAELNSKGVNLLLCALLILLERADR